ncbi:MAG: hypothetical protein GDA66_12270 [Nitrospira sp. CR1.2]|nr:hypothetical protein [Nitrospira sp. CR1.2]
MNPDRTLVRLIWAIAVLNAAHTVDHVIRGDFHWPLDEQSIGFILVVTSIYLVIGIGLRRSHSGMVGPRFWAIVGGAGLALGWLSHFSPFTDQPVHVMYDAYHGTIGGPLAVVCLMLLMGVVLVATTYSAYLWHDQRRHSTTGPASG